MFDMQTVGLTQIRLRLAGIAASIDSEKPLEAASDAAYEKTRQRFDTEGDGEWEQLTESTVAKKASQGYGEPERILYAEGNLYESATSPNGPYSRRIFQGIPMAGAKSVVMMIDWDNEGWQIPTVLDLGNEERGLPGRPIWPPADQLVDDVRDAYLKALA